jgi:hypothetical protein
VGCLGEVWEGRFEGEGVWRLEEHECHRWAEEDDVCVWVFRQAFVFEVSIGIDSAFYMAESEGGSSTLPRRQLPGVTVSMSHHQFGTGKHTLSVSQSSRIVSTSSFVTGSSQSCRLWLRLASRSIHTTYIVICSLSLVFSDRVESPGRKVKTHSSDTHLLDQASSV